mmetsp:Transcript_81364/g.242502  ORF Transcript_81364/g.242502 Transcript_81364/m.242502 type:complete len:336 (+) Transcript_81364:58-1065(+)
MNTASGAISFDASQLQLPGDEAQSALSFTYSAVPPSPLTAIPSPTKTVRGHGKTFKQRLLNAEALEETTQARLQAQRTVLNDAKEARLKEANAARKENRRMIQEAGLGKVKAPGFEQSKSLTERLRMIDQAARANAQCIQERRHMIDQAIKDEEEQRRLDAEAKAKRKSLVIESPSSKMTWRELQRERLRKLRPLQGADAAERMAASIANLKELLPRCASELSWAERRLEEKQAALQSSASAGSLATGSALPQEPGDAVNSWPPASPAARDPGGQAVRLPGMGVKSASAPSVLKGTCPLVPKPGHTKLYPSMMERYRVIEGHARQNATLIQSLRS